MFVTIVKYVTVWFTAIIIKNWGKVFIVGQASDVML